MANLSVKLWQALQLLKEDEFKKFKWLLKQDDVSEGHSGISAAQLEKADRQDTVDLMTQKYGSTGATEETMKALRKISRNDLAQSLQKSCLDPKDLRLKDDEKKKAEQRSDQQLAVDATLDPETSCPNVISSGDGKKVHDGDGKKKLWVRFVLVLILISFLWAALMLWPHPHVESTSMRDLSSVTEESKGDAAGTKLEMVRNGGLGGEGDITTVQEMDYPSTFEESCLGAEMYLEAMQQFKAEQKYCSAGATGETMKTSEKISWNDLAQTLQTSCLETSDLRPQDSEIKKAKKKKGKKQKKQKKKDKKKEKKKKKEEEKKSVQQFPVDVTLDPDKSDPNLISSGDGK